MKAEITSPLHLLIVCLIAVILAFSTSVAVAGPEKPFYITAGLTVFAEENEDVESYIETTVDLIADPALVSSGRVVFPGIKIPVLAAELDYEDYDGGAFLLGWRFAEHFSLELTLAETRELDVSFDLPVQTINLANFISDSTLVGIGNPGPGSIAAPAILGRLATFELLEVALGSNYRFSVSDVYQFYLGVGIIGFKEMDTDVNALSGINTAALKTDFDSDLDFYFQAGFDYLITDHLSLTLDIKQISSESTISFENIQLAASDPDTKVSAGTLKTEFDLSGNLYHLGLRFLF